MLIFKQVTVSRIHLTKCSSFLRVMCIFALGNFLFACDDQSPAPTKIDSEKSTQEEAHVISIRPAQENILTTSLLQEKGATKLNTNEILNLLVDHSIVFEHLGTGEYFEAIYKKDGHRLLTNVDSDNLDDDTLHDAYFVKDDKLQTEFKGKKISSSIYKFEQRYLASIDSDDGVVNYEIRDIVKAPLTVAVLKSQNAKTLSTDEIKKLFVGKNILIKDLLTGDKYIGFYDDNGTRTLQYNNPATTPGYDKEIMKTSDSYKIHDNKLHSLLDGNGIASTIFQVDSAYYGALSVDDGAVNFEFIPQ